MIELKIDKLENGKVFFHISRQDEEDYKRLNILGGRRYGKYCLMCANHPEVREKNFFVRGNAESLNNMKCCVDFNDYLDIYDSIKAYNRNEYFRS